MAVTRRWRSSRHPCAHVDSFRTEQQSRWRLRKRIRSDVNVSYEHHASWHGSCIQASGCYSHDPAAGSAPIGVLAAPSVSNMSLRQKIASRHVLRNIYITGISNEDDLFGSSFVMMLCLEQCDHLVSWQQWLQGAPRSRLERRLWLQVAAATLPG